MFTDIRDITKSNIKMLIQGSLPEQLQLGRGLFCPVRCSLLYLKLQVHFWWWSHNPATSGTLLTITGCGPSMIFKYMLKWFCERYMFPLNTRWHWWRWHDWDISHVLTVPSKHMSIDVLQEVGSKTIWLEYYCCWIPTSRNRVLKSFSLVRIKRW